MLDAISHLVGQHFQKKQLRFLAELLGLQRKCLGDRKTFPKVPTFLLGKKSTC